MPGGRPRRARSDTAAGAIARAAAVQAARPAPPLDLPEGALRFFDAIIDGREGATWKAHDLNLACILATTMHHLSKIEAALAVSGYLAEGRSGQRTNPLLGAMLSASQSVQALTRSLGLSASQRGLTHHDQRARDEADAAAREVISRARDEDLLA